ncbi:hypothetical protein M434DRAFT_8481 [Hypoxylon sp. CO27-5]|nr:hypothetical protein M434DRAFT_8481 [Hypoxylon sp. CO27-5]
MANLIIPSKKFEELTLAYQEFINLITQSLGDSSPVKASTEITGNCGTGTLESPLIEWTCNIAQDDCLIRYECEIIFGRLAKEFRCSHIYVMQSPQETIETFNTLIKKETNTNSQWLNRAGNHLIVMFGSQSKHCDILGHVYLAIDKDNTLDFFASRKFPVGFIYLDCVKAKHPRWLTVRWIRSIDMINRGAVSVCIKLSY